MLAMPIYFFQLFKKNNNLTHIVTWTNNLVAYTKTRLHLTIL